SIVLVFFFQAEDGIRDWSVTGVQTCALPISTATVLAPFSGKTDQGGPSGPTGSSSKSTASTVVAATAAAAAPAHRAKTASACRVDRKSVVEGKGVDVGGGGGLRNKRRRGGRS